jgi:hypothetical protein
VAAQGRSEPRRRAWARLGTRRGEVDFF